MILVDDRTGSAELDPLLQSPHALVRLDYGDACWMGKGQDGPVNVAVERKGLMDLLQSMTTGRLSGHQLIGLLREYDYVYLVVEGVWRPDRHNGMLHHINRKGQWRAVAQGSRRFMARDIYRYLNTLAVQCGVMVVQTGSMWDTAKWIDSVYGWWQRSWDKHKSHQQWHRPTVQASLSKPNLSTRIASQFEGIGWEKARALGKEFPLPQMLLDATIGELQGVEGIGPKLAESIVEQRNGE